MYPQLPYNACFMTHSFTRHPAKGAGAKAARAANMMSQHPMLFKDTPGRITAWMGPGPGQPPPLSLGASKVAPFKGPSYYTY